MRVLQLLEMKGHDPANVIGPNAIAEELIVERDDEPGSPEAIVSIRDGVFFVVSQDPVQEPGLITEPEFRAASSLRYGPPSALRPNPFDPWNMTDRTTFRVFNSVPGTPFLYFKDESYITAIDPGAITPGENDLLLESFRTSIAIKSHVSALPARDWYTGDTDLFIRKDSDITLEAISEDGCNLWFVDVAEPRCVKYWRNLHLRAATLTPVDDDDNHVCGPEPLAPKDGAIYVLEDIGTDGSVGTLDLINGVNVYYGGALDPFQMMSFPNGKPRPFKKTVYGDFDGNCLVTSADVTILIDFLGSTAGRCDWPMADWDGDCVVNIVDLTEVMDRAGSIIANPDCNPLDAIVCPNQPLLSGDGGGGGAPASGEAIAAFSDATVDFIASQEPVGDEETRDLAAAVNSLSRIALPDFSREQRTSLASALEAARDAYRNPTTRRLADNLAHSLRQ